MLNTPILFLVFNRPNVTSQVFEEIRKVKPSKLFIAADGPRMENIGEKEKCEQVREIATAIDWDCEVETLFRDTNMGCGPAVSQAITWFFEHVEQGIIIEDDCLPHPSFFGFCEELLKYYKNDPRVWYISGDNFQGGFKRGKGSYYFSMHLHIWGWATWKDRWANYEYDVSKLHFNSIKHYTKNKEAIEYFRVIYEMMKEQKNNTWDYQLMFSMWQHKGLTIIPQKNLISNLGFGEDSTHTKNSDSPSNRAKIYSIGEIIHPRTVSQNKIADQFTFFYMLKVNPKTFYQRAWQKVKNIFTKKLKFSTN